MRVLRASAAVLASLCAVSTLLAGPLSASVQAAVLPLDPFTDWCSGGTSTSTALAGLTAAVPVSLDGTLTSGFTSGDIDWLAANGIDAGGAALTDVTLPALAAFGASYCGTTRVLHWLFGSGHAAETGATGTPTTTTTYGGGCWARLFGSGYDSTCQVASASSGARYDAYTSGSMTVTAVDTPAWGTNGAMSFSITGVPSGYTVYGGLDCSTLVDATASDQSAQVTRDGSGTLTFPSGSCASGTYPAGFTIYDDLYSRVDAFYLFGGATSWPSGEAPDHKLRFTVDCKAIDGSVTTHTTYSATFKEADTTLPDIELPACPTGQVPVHRTAVEGDATGANGTSIFEWTANPTVQQYAECLPGGAQAPCSMVLWQRADTASAWQVCTAAGVDCATYDGTNGESLYRCTWGNYTVADSDCVDVNPDTSTDTSTATDPTTNDSGCPPSVWSILNPLNVFHTLSCAFIPSSDQVTQLQTDVSSISDTVPFSYVGDAVSWVGTAVGGGSGHCIQYGVTVGPFGHVWLLDTCTPGPIEGVLMSYRGVLAVVLFVSFLAPLAWWAWRTYAPGSTGSA